MISCPSSHPEPGKLPVNWHIGDKLPRRVELVVIFSCHAHLLVWSSAAGVSWENTVLINLLVDIIEIVLSAKISLTLSIIIYQVVLESVFI